MMQGVRSLAAEPAVRVIILFTNQFKYINIYEYKDGHYIKRNIEEYITYSRELKYIRKENK